MPVFKAITWRNTSFEGSIAESWHCWNPISGWAAMIFYSISCLWSSSLVSEHMAFWRLSNIIFSTVLQVSESNTEILQISAEPKFSK